MKPSFHYLENNNKTKLDTSSLLNVHEYRKDNQYLWIGNNGLSNYSLTFDLKESVGYNVSHFLKDVQEYSYKEYDVFSPFTSVKFVQGARLEQYFELVHTQNFSKDGNFSLSYKKINSDGSYLRQKSNNNDLNASIWYTKNRYKISFFANRIKNATQQNGGIVYDTTFTVISDFGSNRKTIPINLDSATDLKISNQLALFQEISLLNNRDTLGFGATSKFEFKSKFTNSKRFYKDNEINVDFYQSIFLDSSATNDSIKLNQIEQEIAYVFSNKQSKYAVDLTPRINYYYTDYKQADYHRYLNELSLGFKGFYKRSKINLETDFNYFIKGYRINNYNFKTVIKTNFTKHLEWFISSDIQKYNPSLDLARYKGNHSIWDNSFISTQVLSFSTGTYNNKWNVLASFTYTDIKNPIYFNYQSIPQQVLDYSQILKMDLAKEFKLKKWRITPQFVYQYTGGVLAYRLPNYFGSLKFGYSFKTFKKSLSVFTGLKLTYYSDVELMSYSPSLGQYYLADNNNVGNYPFVDFFINTRIKSVRLFFALTHLNAGLAKQNNYFGAQHYPLEDRAYKIGINWNFLK